MAFGDHRLHVVGGKLEPPEHVGLLIDPEHARPIRTPDPDAVAVALVDLGRLDQLGLRGVVQERLQRVVGKEEDQLQREPGETQCGPIGRRVGDPVIGEERLYGDLGRRLALERLVGYVRHRRPQLLAVANDQPTKGVSPNLVGPGKCGHEVRLVAQWLAVQLILHLDVAPVVVRGSFLVCRDHGVEDLSGSGLLAGGCFRSFCWGGLSIRAGCLAARTRGLSHSGPGLRRCGRVGRPTASPAGHSRRQPSDYQTRAQNPPHRFRLAMENSHQIPSSLRRD